MESKDITKIAILASLYAVTGLIPISTFIGAPSFLGLNLIMVPVIAFTLQPTHAFISSLIGGVIGLMISPSQAMFGLLSPLVPIMGATFGSITYHNENGRLFSFSFLIVAITAYIIKAGTFPYFVLPHVLALVCIALIQVNSESRIIVPLVSYSSTMCEQGMMMILATWMLGLPAPVFSIILPLMIYERVVATVGSSIIITSTKLVEKRI